MAVKWNVIDPDAAAALAANTKGCADDIETTCATLQAKAEALEGLDGTFGMNEQVRDYANEIKNIFSGLVEPVRTMGLEMDASVAASNAAVEAAAGHALFQN